MRTKNSINNLVISISLSIVTMLLGLIAQKVFIHVLGTEYLGLNSLFSSIISILALLELGIGTSVFYHLYKPLADGDTSKIKSILKFYKKSYRIISAIVFLVGLAVIPFLGLIVGKTNIKDNIDLIYILFLIKVLCDYILTYKRSILYADQKN
jgi:O-antigen/teichoic acid export membrane protein